MRTLPRHEDMGRPDHAHRSMLATIGLVALPLLCCGLPALATAGALAGAGGWLVANGSWLGGGLVAAAAITLLSRRRFRQGRCEVPSPAPSAGAASRAVSPRRSEEAR